MRMPTLALGALWCTMAMAQGKALPLQTVERADHRCSVKVPATWEVTQRDLQEHDLLRFDAQAPGVEGIAKITVVHVAGQRDVLRQLAYERDGAERETRYSSVEGKLHPLPHLLLREGEGDEARLVATWYAMTGRNGTDVQVRCAAGGWPALREALHEMARSLRAELPEWPAHPADLRRETKDGFLYLSHPTVKRSDLKRLQSFIRDTTKWFEKLNGKIPRSAGNPPIVLLYNSMADAAPALGTEKPEQPTVHLDVTGGRIFMVPLPEEEGGQHALYASRLWGLLHMEMYGGLVPYWMCTGEAQLAWSHRISGTVPPQLMISQATTLPKAPLRLDEVIGRGQESGTPLGDDFVANTIAYTLYFAAGPPKYKRAYADFRKELAATHDAREATAAHLLSLDQAELQADLTRWLARSVEAVNAK